MTSTAIVPISGRPARSVSENVKVARLQAKAQDRERLAKIAGAVLANPLFAGLSALAANQLAYKAGLWDPRASADGRYYTWKTTWGFDTTGGFHIDFGNQEWVPADKEEIAAENATQIGAMIIAATIAYAAVKPSFTLTPGV